MDLYLSAPRSGKNHPEVVALSAVLRSAAIGNAGLVQASFRNPAGIAMRLRNFGRLDPNGLEDRDAGLRPGGTVDRQVWADFGGKEQLLASEVARVRKAMAERRWQAEQKSSRGPVPTFGRRDFTFDDRGTGVYLLLIDGPADLLVPGILNDPDRSVVKLGRTSNLDRRLTELSCGLPACTSIQYVPLGLRLFKAASDAHAFERHLLDLCDREGWSLGGEFAYAPVAQLKAALCAKISQAPS